MSASVDSPILTVCFSLREGLTPGAVPAVWYRMKKPELVSLKVNRVANGYIVNAGNFETGCCADNSTVFVFKTVEELGVFIAEQMPVEDTK